MSLIDQSAAVANALIGDLSAPFVLIPSSNRYIGQLIPNVTIRESHTDEDTITNHPVETGTPISDHVFANPQLLEITFGFSDSAAGYDGYVQQMYEAILAQKAQRQPFDISTGKRYYQNMLFARVNVITDDTNEYALMVNAVFQQVIIVGTDAGGSSSNLADPASSASSSDVGTQSLQSAPGAPDFGDYETSFVTTPAGGAGIGSA